AGEQCVGPAKRAAAPLDDPAGPGQRRELDPTEVGGAEVGGSESEVGLGALGRARAAGAVRARPQLPSTGVPRTELVVDVGHRVEGPQLTDLDDVAGQAVLPALAGAIDEIAVGLAAGRFVHHVEASAGPAALVLGIGEVGVPVAVEPVQLAGAGQPGPVVEG